MVLHQSHPEVLRSLLESYSKEDNEFWSFKDKAIREHTHIYFQYPAMMVPKMQGQLIEAVREVEPGIRSVFDPFVGSGTTMTEAMLQGLDFIGQDVNPLAILICRAKVGPFFEEALYNKLHTILKLIDSDDSIHIDVDFRGRDKWFQQKVSIELSRIRRAIRNEHTLWMRRFFWVAFAETVRLTSNSRTSTFKLHMRLTSDIEKRERELSPISLFEGIAMRNLQNLSKQKVLLEERGFLEKGFYRKNVEIKLANSLETTSYKEQYDLLITSPPYGDNKSTVPYGQHAFLPLQWIDWKDIDEDMNYEWLKTTHEIDSRSLGGSLFGALEDTAELRSRSSSFKQIIDELENAPRDRRVRIAAFYRDLNLCLDPILLALKPSAYMIWTVGNRRVAGKPVPIDEILVELLQARGANFVTKLQRTIPTKRMALKNKITPTMGAEAIVVMRKANT